MGVAWVQDEVCVWDGYRMRCVGDEGGGCCMGAG